MGQNSLQMGQNSLQREQNSLFVDFVVQRYKFLFI